MRKSLAITLSFFVFLSCISVNLSFHYCGGDIKSFALFGEAKPCSHAKDSDQPSCPLHKEKINHENKNCCNNKTIQADGIDHIASATHHELKIQPLISFIITFSQSLFLYSGQNDFLAENTAYKPPTPDKDIPVLLQSFII